MKIPDKVQLIDSTVKIIIRKNLLEHQGCLGCCDTERKIIELDAGMTKQEKFRVFMHELVEYIFIDLGCSINRIAEERMYLVTHREVDLMAKMLAQALK